MNNLQKQYFELLASQQFQEEELDYSVLDRHIAALNSSNIFSGSALSIFDLYRREHVYESEYHKKLFMDPQGEYAGVQIHPEDYMLVTKNGVAGMRHVFMHKKQNRYVKSNKLIREYRVLIHGVYKRITEEMQILEMDNRGNVWLVLSIVNISPNQLPPFKVVSQLINFQTGDVFSPLDDYFDKDSILSQREVEILKWIGKGYLSKEIADRLHISIHTVNTHRQRILEKLNVDNSIEAIKYAQILGILED